MIGVLDSGLGGLATTRALLDLLPSLEIVYYCDSARGPYGGNSPETIRSFALEGARFLMESGARLIVIACHDISATASKALSENFSVGIVDAITPLVKRAVKVSKHKRIGVMGTRAIIDSGIFEKRIKEMEPGAKVYSQACPVLSALIREGWFKKPETNMIVKKCIQPLKVRQIDALIAGSAEYSLLSDEIVRKAGKRVALVEPASVVANYLADYLVDCPPLGREPEPEKPIRFFVSDLTSHIEEAARKFYGKNLTLEKVSL